MRLKLSGPDYKDKDPVKSLEDFKQRVKAYESAYQPIGRWEEDHDLQYIQVGIPVLRCYFSLTWPDDRCWSQGGSP